MSLATRTLASLAALALLAGCGDPTSLGESPPIRPAMLVVVNAAAAPVDVLVDGQVVSRAVQAGHLSSRVGLDAGRHEIVMRTGSGASATVQATATAGGTLVAAALAGAGSGIAASVLSDTGAVVPPGKSKLRVAHLSTLDTAVELWRTQPDWQTPVHIMTPFHYRDVSPYLQSDPGRWEVIATTPGGARRLATTGAINVPAGQRRTVVLVDSAGVPIFHVVEE